VSRSPRLFWAVGVAILVALVLLTPPAENPGSAVALRRYLTSMGFEVSDASSPPEVGGTLILLHDLRVPQEEGSILSWVRAGGRLVVADPTSAILGAVGASRLGPVGFANTVEIGPACVAPEAIGVGKVVIRASDVALRAIDAAFVSCLPAGDGAFILTRRFGDGRITLLGGMSPLTNALLPAEDNAVLALQLAAPGRQVVFGPPLPPGSSGAGGLWDLVPDSAKAGGAAAILAAIVFALARARRLGRPVPEEALAPIPASELVRATARMYRRGRAVAYSGALLREATVARLARSRGATNRGAELVTAVSHASAVPEERVREILDGPAPSTDADLISLGRDLEELASRTRQGAR
jgi:hypothetical protein